MIETSEVAKRESYSLIALAVAGVLVLGVTFVLIAYPIGVFAHFLVLWLAVPFILYGVSYQRRRTRHGAADDLPPPERS